IHTHMVSHSHTHPHTWPVTHTYIHTYTQPIPITRSHTTNTHNSQVRILHTHLARHTNTPTRTQTCLHDKLTQMQTHTHTQNTQFTGYNAKHTYSTTLQITHIYQQHDITRLQ